MLLKDELPKIQKNEVESLCLLPKENNIMHLGWGCTIISDEVDTEEAGRVIMANTSIESVRLSFFREIDSTKYMSFLSGISKNKSIKSIEVCDSNIDERFFKMIDAKRLRNLYINDCDITFDIFAAVTVRGGGTNHPLQKLKIWHSALKLDDIRN